MSADCATRPSKPAASLGRSKSAAAQKLRLFPACTGASAGIGEACAWRFAAEGCKLVLIARRQERLEALAAGLRQHYNVAVHTVAMDVRDLDAIARLPEELPEEFQVNV